MKYKSKYYKKGEKSKEKKTEEKVDKIKDLGKIVYHSKATQFPWCKRNVHLSTEVPGSTSNAVFTAYSYKGNSFHLTGPDTNYSGTFSANVPAGLNTLLNGAATTAGVIGAYREYRIRGSRITITCISNASNTVGGRLFCYPSLNASGSGVGINTAAEQQGGKYIDIPALTEGKAIKLVNSMDTHIMFGVSPEMIQDSAYVGVGGTGDPNVQFYWQIGIGSQDGSSTYPCAITVRIDYVVDFMARNTNVSTVPS
jgi:hypothetical protein